MFLCDNTQPYIQYMQQLDKLQICDWSDLHILYINPNIVPSDFNLFWPLKEAVVGKKFSTDEETKEDVHSWLQDSQNNLF